jgi:uncharacterized protein YegJ (DUF2314 family)
MSEDEPILWVEGETPDFVAAIRRAQATFVPSFAEPLAREESETQWANVEAAIVKIFFPDPSDPTCGEHLWVNYHRWTGEWVVGEMTGEPRLPNLKPGQRVRAPLARLSDWVSVIKGKASGGFTLPLVLSSVSAEDAAALRREPPFCWFASSIDGSAAS